VKKKTLIQIAQENVGTRQSIRAYRFVVTWWMFLDVLGRPPANIEEYARLTGVSIATAYRELKVFREAYPGHETPDDLLEDIPKAIRDRMRLAGERLNRAAKKDAES
jgi:hypothetical protein